MSNKITYRDLFTMLENGCVSITLPISSYDSFIRYATKSKSINKLHFEKLTNVFVVKKIK